MVGEVANDFFAVDEQANAIIAHRVKCIGRTESREDLPGPPHADTRAVDSCRREGIAEIQVYRGVISHRVRAREARIIIVTPG
jgi:hypothetical protein